jgi:uncharacterized protein involved in response to NO
MVFGFAAAAVGGFLLTAVPSWTGRAPLKGLPLALLVAAWLLGRIAMAVAVAPSLVLTLLDLLYPVGLAVIVAGDIVAAASRRNYQVALIVGALAVVDLVYHLSAAALVPFPPSSALVLALYLLLLLVVIISGRVIPAFTRNWLLLRAESRLPISRAWLEPLVIPVTAAMAVADSLLPGSWVTGLLAMFAALVHGLRLAGWRGWAVAREPLLAVLHVAYLWLVIGFVLLAVSAVAAAGTRGAAIHALTIGAIGTMALGLMSRASLGHTGRSLRAPTPVVVAYVLLSVAAVARLAAGWAQSLYPWLIALSGGVWMVAFALFLVSYGPILLRPRVDGRSG